MEDKEIERRTCKRLKIPGATVTYLESRSFLTKKKYNEEPFPVIEISRGGIRFVGQKLISPSRRITMKISIPDENIPLILQGEVKWATLSPTMSYKYQIGVKFSPYGEKKEDNKPEILERIIALEKKFSENNRSGSH